jgi:hypothetical protein
MTSSGAKASSSSAGKSAETGSTTGAVPPFFLELVGGFSLMVTFGFFEAAALVTFNPFTGDVGALDWGFDVRVSLNGSFVCVGGVFFANPVMTAAGGFWGDTEDVVRCGDVRCGCFLSGFKSLSMGGIE